MSATLHRLADHRPKRREPDAMSLLLGQFEFIALCNIAVLYALVCACWVATEGHRTESARKG